jgi:hypothetical protein
MPLSDAQRSLLDAIADAPSAYGLRRTKRLEATSRELIDAELAVCWTFKRRARLALTPWGAHVLAELRAADLAVIELEELLPVWGNPNDEPENVILPGSTGAAGYQLEHAADKPPKAPSFLEDASEVDEDGQAVDAEGNPVKVLLAPVIVDPRLGRRRGQAGKRRSA